MGNDGGSIPYRAELVKTKKAPPKKDVTQAARTKWLYCPLSLTPLKPPIVGDRVGNTFNKEGLIRCLINKTLPKQYKHISSLKDVFEVNFTANESYDPNSKRSAGEYQALDSPFECPITSKPVNGFNDCGHVFSTKGLKETSTSDSQCFVCAKPFAKEDVVELHPPKEKAAALQEEILSRKKAEKAERKASRKKKREATEGEEKKTEEPMAKKKKTSASTTASSSTSKSASNSLAVLVAASKAKEEHTKKKVSTAYNSIFSDSSKQSTERPNPTGHYLH